MLEIPEPTLAERTTMRLGGKAIAELTPENMQDMRLLPEKIRSLGGKPLVIGRGSNLLAADHDLPLVLIRPKLKEKLEVWARSGDKIYVRAGAGVPLARVLRFCLRNGLSGLEGLVGIPGTAGGAAAMNAGSFGMDTGQVLHSLLVWTESGLTLLKQEDMQFSYRHADFRTLSGTPVILEVIFALTIDSKGAILSRMNLNFFEKKSRQPVTAWSAGCAFKNPADAPSAGRLLDEAGFRGREKGGIAFSHKHANFLVNTGKGSARAAFELMEEAQNAVFDKFGIKLEPEVRIIT